MHRDMVIKMADGCTITDSQSSQTRMTESKGKKNSNNKICVFSQKYIPITINTKQLEEQSTSRLIIPISKVKPELHSTTSQCLSTQGDAKQYKTDQKQSRTTINSYEIKRIKDQPFRLNQRTIQAISEKIASVQSVYESKIRKVIEDNAKMVNELRILLIENQRKLVEKDIIIQRLIAVSLSRQTPPPADKIQRVSVNVPNTSQSSFLQNKIKDLESMLRVIISNLMSEEQNRSMKIQQIENLLVRHHFMRIASCSYRLQNYINQIDKKLISLEEGINSFTRKNDSNLPVRNNNFVPDIKEIKTKIMQFSEEICNFKTKQFKHQNQAVGRLQNILISLLERVDQIQILRGSRKLGNSAVFDEDEFFYPPSIGKIYETNDQYQHFQSQSEEQSTDFPSLNHSARKKQNKSPNQGHYQSPKLSYR